MATQLSTERSVAGRPTDYDPAYCDIVVQYGKEGCSYVQIACRLNIGRATLYRWRDAHEDFREALDRARQEALGWWEDVGQAGLNIKSFNALLWDKQVRARFKDEGYGDAGPVNFTQINMTQEVDTLDLAKRVFALLSKVETSDGVA